MQFLAGALGSVLVLGTVLGLQDAKSEPSPVPLPMGRTVVFVRHAEKATAGGEDPELSPRGVERAQEIARLLQHAGVDRIYVSTFRRTQQTMAPLAKSLGLEPVVVQAADHDRMLEALQKEEAGSVVVVCTHSNVMPKLARALGVAPDRLDAKARIPEDDHTRVYVVDLPAQGVPQAPKLVELALTP